MLETLGADRKNNIKQFLPSRNTCRIGDKAQKLNEPSHEGTTLLTVQPPLIQQAQHWALAEVWSQPRKWVLLSLFTACDVQRKPGLKKLSNTPRGHKFPEPRFTARSEGWENPLPFHYLTPISGSSQ